MHLWNFYRQQMRLPYLRKQDLRSTSKEEEDGFFTGSDFVENIGNLHFYHFFSWIMGGKMGGIHAL